MADNTTAQSQNDNNSARHKGRPRKKPLVIGGGATVHGAVSIVNAVASNKGATVGIELKVNAEVKRTIGGNGITIIRSEKNKSLSTKLILQTVKNTIPKNILDSSHTEVKVSSEIPAGVGLKSSSAISSAVARACSRAYKRSLPGQTVLLAGVKASIETKVSITGAYDDACGCYYGGFNVTDNSKYAIARRECAPTDMSVVIFIPKKIKRGNPKKLKLLEHVFVNAWKMAKKSEYWNAMTINGLATESVLGAPPGIITDLIEGGAEAASISGNGPAIAAVVKKENIQNVKKVFAPMDGRIIVSAFNNKKAESYDIL